MAGRELSVSVAISNLRPSDVTAIRVGLTILLLARPGRAWSSDFAAHRLRRDRVAAVLHELRDHPAAIASLRVYWHDHHLSNERLADEVLINAFADAAVQGRLDVLVLPRLRLPVSPPLQPLSRTGSLRPPAAGTAATAGSARSVTQWDLKERLAYVFPLAAADVPTAIGDLLRGFATPARLAIFAALIPLEVAGLAAGGIGLAANAILVAALWTMCGLAAFQAIGALADFMRHTMDATSDQDLDVAAKDLARAAVLLGVTALTFFGGWAKAKSVSGRIGGRVAAADATDTGTGQPAGRPTPQARIRRQANESPPPEPKPGFADAAKLQDHFDRHGGDFGAKTPAEYEAQAKAFLTGPKPSGVLEKVRSNGDIGRYNPTTDEFGVASPSAIRTYFKPDPTVHGMPTNLDYFLAQITGDLRCIPAQSAATQGSMSRPMTGTIVQPLSFARRAALSLATTMQRNIIPRSAGSGSKEGCAGGAVRPIRPPAGTQYADFRHRA